MLTALGALEDRARAAFADLARAYASPGRYYHTLPHIGQVLATIESLREDAGDLPAVQLAAWFHDVVYDPRAGDNEEQSAVYAGRALRELGLPAATIGKVGAMIWATTRHECAPDDLDTQILLDADLAILGAGEAEYRRYSQNIRQEYAWVPEAEYRAARQRALRSFLERERIYHTQALFQAREACARRNVAQEIAALS